MTKNKMLQDFPKLKNRFLNDLKDKRLRKYT